MIEIHDSQNIHLEKGLNELEINSNVAVNLSLELEDNANVFIKILSCTNLTVNADILEGRKASILYWNDTEEKVDINENYNVHANSDLNIGYSECNISNTDRETTIHLKESGANALVTSSCLVNANKNLRMRVINEAPQTFGDIKNFAVVLKDGRLMIDAIGEIKKGASRSESHQTSRALSFAEGQKATILPELLIDENDVQASHAMSIGRVDEDQLYYMMSRGLSVEECTSLISTGYLLPIVDLIEDEDLRNRLSEELERKINTLCSM